MNTLVIEARGLVKGFTDGAGRRLRAVDGVVLTVRPGEIIGLLGPNGAGKSTLLDMILGLTQPDQGTVRLFGNSPKASISAGRVGAVLQTGGLLPNLSVRDTVRMIAATHRTPVDVNAALDQAGLTELAGRKVAKCSGGERQRLRFALAILSRPDLLILDEPTAGMDAAARHAFWQAMKAQAQQGRTVIFATHYIEEAQNFAERIVMVGHGRIIADGATEDVRAGAGTRSVTAILPDDVDAASLPGVTSVELNGAHTCMTTEDSDTLARHLLTQTAARDLTVASSSLEDAFLHLTTDDANRNASAA